MKRETLDEVKKIAKSVGKTHKLMRERDLTRTELGQVKTMLRLQSQIVGNIIKLEDQK